MEQGQVHVKQLERQNGSYGRELEPVFLFLHMPKCAGTTFRVHIENNLSPDEILPLYIGIDKRFRERDYVKEYIASLPEERKIKLKLVYGHEVHYGIHDWLGRQGRYFTFLRHPLPRTISWYNYRRQRNWVDKKIIDMFIDRGTTPTLQQWLENSPFVWNEMTGYFADFGYCERKEHYSDQELDRILDIFFFIGLTETFDDDALFLYYLLGIKKKFFRPQNISKKYFNAEEEAITPLIPLVLKKNEYDMGIYSKAVDRHDKMIHVEPSYRRNIFHMRLRRTVTPALRRLEKLIFRNSNS
jgi:hypothetical protein